MQPACSPHPACAVSTSTIFLPDFRPVQSAPARPAPLRQCVLLALLLHLWALLLLGNAPGGTAQPGEGVGGAINITLRGAETPGAQEVAVPTQPEVPAGPPGAAPTPRWGGSVRAAAPAETAAEGAAQLGRWSALPGLATPATAPAPAEPALEAVPQAAVPVLPAAVPDIQPRAETARSLSSSLAREPAPRPDSAPLPSAPAAAQPVRALPAAPRLPELAPPPQTLPPVLPALQASPAAPQAAVAPLAREAPVAAPPRADAMPALAPPPEPALRRLAAPVPAVSQVAPPLSAQPLATQTQAAPPAVPALPALPAGPAVAPAVNPTGSRPVSPPVTPPVNPPLSQTLSPPLGPPPSSPLSPPSTQPSSLPSSPASSLATPGTPPPSTSGAGTPSTPGTPDSGARVGHDVATPPSAAASVPPRLNLELARPRGGELSRMGSMGALPLLPRPPDVPNKLSKDIEKAGRNDCRTAYSGAGLLAVVPLAVDALKKEGGCKW